MKTTKKTGSKKNAKTMGGTITSKKSVVKRKRKTKRGVIRMAILKRILKKQYPNITFSKKYTTLLNQYLGDVGERLIDNSVLHTESLKRKGLTSSSLRYSCQEIIPGDLSTVCVDQIKNSRQNKK